MRCRAVTREALVRKQSLNEEGGDDENCAERAAPLSQTFILWQPFRVDPIIYLRRRSAIARSEREWRVEQDALVTRGGTGGEKRYPWTDFISVRLCHEPVRFRPWRYVFELQPRKGAKLVIDNAHYISVGRFEDRSEAYARFVRAAVERLAVAKPGGTALIGETPKRYFFLLLFALIGLGAVAFALIAVPTPLDALPLAGVIKLAIILLMLPIFWAWVLKAMPRGVPLNAIPARALPPLATG
jgi:hypothetical protein